MNTDIIEQDICLTDEKFFGKGTQKRCYIHPQDNSLCIKVQYSFNAGVEKQLKREIKYNNLLEKRLTSSVTLPKYYGEISTNMGSGYLYDLVRDYDGNISQTLDHYLESNDFLEANFAKIVSEFKALKENLLKERVIPMSLYPINIVYKKESEETARLVIIDDIGSAAFIPLEYYFSFAAKSRINRKWANFVNFIKKEYHRPLIADLTKQII